MITNKRAGRQGPACAHTLFSHRTQLVGSTASGAALAKQSVGHVYAAIPPQDVRPLSSYSTISMMGY